MRDSGRLLRGRLVIETRLAYADFLAAAGLNTCLYCPKADPYLRKQWQSTGQLAQWQQLFELARGYRQGGINWGVGLSPFELYRHYGAAAANSSSAKSADCAELDAPLLAILFDDMPGELEALASGRRKSLSDVVSWLPGVRVLVCPTYYSFDPVLEKFFGRMPTDYWSQLWVASLPAGCGYLLDRQQGLLRHHHPAMTLKQICARLGRPVVLWDNYPVNDGAARSNFLYCSPLRGRESLTQEHCLAGTCATR